MGNIDNTIKIYEELKSCTSHKEVLHLKEKLEGGPKGVCNKEVENLCRRTANLIREVNELVAQGEFHNAEVSEEVVVELPTTELVGQKFQSDMVKLCEYLMNDEVSVIGIYGMGGVGKTTLVKHVHNEVLKNPKIYGSVYWVTVSNDCTIHQLQSKIAKELLGEDFSNEDDLSKRAGILKKASQNNRYVLFLDDVWKYYDLINLGIPSWSGCKLVLTTRWFNVCSEIGCDETIEVRVLPEKEAWDLFVKYIKHDIPHSIGKTAKLVAKECAGLPLGIITLARSMRISDDICDWRRLLNRLRNSRAGVPAMEEHVFQLLRMSYDRLNDLKLQECLLYCAAYPEDYQIFREDLIWVLIGKGLFGGMSSMQEMIDEGHSILNELERACLLSGYDSGSGDKWVKMHDLIRDMALQIAGTRFMVKAGLGLTDFPDEEEWTEYLEVVSLMHNGSIESPDMSPRCPTLSIFLLQETDLSVPDSFFENLYALKVLDFSNTGIRILTDSILCLKNLCVLLLGGCKNIEDIPGLEDLTTLRILDLSFTGLRKVPEGLEKLTNLRCLNLQTYSLEVLPSGVFRKLTRLEYLLLPWVIPFNRAKVSGQELRRLRKLERFEGHLLDIQDFNSYAIQVNRYRRPNIYVLRVGGDSEYLLDRSADHRERDVIFCNCDISGVELPIDIGNLYIEACNDIRSLCDIPSLNDAICLESCEIFECKEMEYALSSPVSPAAFFRLSKFYMSGCQKMKILFTTDMLKHLQNLQEVKVTECENLVSIIGGPSDEEDGRKEEGTSTTTFVLPNLTTLTLTFLPELTSICSNGVLYSRIPSQNIQIGDCPKLQVNLMPINEESLSRLNFNKNDNDWTTGTSLSIFNLNQSDKDWMEL